MSTETTLAAQDAAAQAEWADIVSQLRSAGAAESDIQTFLDTTASLIDRRLSDFADDLATYAPQSDPPNIDGALVLAFAPSDSPGASTATTVLCAGVSAAICARIQALIALESLVIAATSAAPSLNGFDQVSGSIRNRIDQELEAAVQDDPKAPVHRGRLQIQGPDITIAVKGGQGSVSYPWAMLRIVGKKEGRQMLAVLEQLLTSAARTDRMDALNSAIQYINNCPVVGGCDAPDNRSFPGSAKRVDIELKTGLAFNGLAPNN